MTSDNRWRKFSFRVKDYVTISNNFSIRFIASDSIRLGLNLDGGSLVEAAVDDLYLYESTGINSVSNISNLNIEVYPNPTNGIVNINTENRYSIKLFNILGELIMEEDLIDVSSKIDLSSLKSGIYYIDFYNDKLVDTKKIVLE